MGGDFSPSSVLKGISEYMKFDTKDDYKLVLFGQEKILGSFDVDLTNSKKIEIVHTNEYFTMDDKPLQAFNEKPNASIALGIKHLSEGKIDCFSSAGNTGCMMMGVHKAIPTIEGIKRPCIGTVFYNINGSKSIILDSGLLPEAKPDTLNDFAILGSCYCKSVLKIENPRVSLLNMGTEKGKGNTNLINSYKVLESNPTINFIGNIESDSIFLDKTDVIVCDGYVGNVVIKMCGSFKYLFEKIGNCDEKILDMLNYETFGGAPVLGINNNVIIAHGKSSPTAIKNMISVSKSVSYSNLRLTTTKDISRYYDKK